MTRRKVATYLFQFNFQSGNTFYLPYSVGVLWAYASQAEAVRLHFEKPRFVFMKDEPGAIVSQVVAPDIAAFSTYVWNWEISVRTAELLKQRFPECLIVFGGPHVPDRMDGFFQAFPFIDVAAHGEGEVTFSELLSEYVGERQFTRIAGLSVNDGSAEAGPITKRPRIADLNTLPSPYVSGLFDDLLDQRYNFHAVWETNRGCPYACTFCDWGSATMSKVRTFSEDRLQKEIDWFADHRIQWIYGADANFGILPRDESIAEWLAAKKRQTGFPGKFRVNFAKNSTKRVTDIARILNAVDLDKGITLSMQSMDDTTLRIIKRKNLKIGPLQEFVKDYRHRDIATNTEVIIGLPGETYESFVTGIDALLKAGIHDSIYIYRAQVLPNAELNDPGVRERYAIRTARTPLILNYSTPDEDSVTEYEETIVSTSTMPHEDWKRACLFAWLIQCCHAFNLTQVIAIVLHELTDVDYSVFYSSLLEFAKKHPASVIGQERRYLERQLEDLVAGRLRTNVLEEFASFNWSLEESSYLRISKRLDVFYEELGMFLDQLLQTLKVGLDRDLLKDAMNVQRSILVRWDRCGDRELTLDSNMYSFYRRLFMLEPTALVRGRHLLSIRDTFRFDGDGSRFATDVVFKGRRNIRFMYKEIAESCLAA
jgi:2-(S-pantetheinyl)-carbapenam-3-carboxylate methyltransferase